LGKLTHTNIITFCIRWQCICACA